MKKPLFFLVITMLLITACNQPKSSTQLLDDETQRLELMELIANDQEMMREMSEVMMNSENAKMIMMQNKDMLPMMMMMGNRQMMGKNPGMMRGMMGNMMQLAQTDSVMRNNMAGMMASHREMMQSMMQTMREKGMMTPECMKANMELISKMEMEGDSLR